MASQRPCSRCQHTQFSTAAHVYKLCCLTQGVLRTLHAPHSLLAGHTAAGGTAVEACSYDQASIVTEDAPVSFLLLEVHAPATDHSSP